MFTDQVIVQINIACIAFLALTMTILIAATRLKNGTGYMALASASTTIPVYLSNLIRTLDSEAFEMSIYFAITMNVMCFPFLWFFVRSQLDRSFRFTLLQLLHLLPALISFVAALLYYGPMSATEIAAEREIIETGHENLPAVINDILLFGQFFVYFPLMFRFVNGRKQYILENYTDSDYVLLLWLPRFLKLFFVLFFIVFVAYIIDPRTDAWLIPIFNTIGMAYLTYCAVIHSSAATIGRRIDIPPTEKKSAAILEMDMEEMRAICKQASDYAISTQAYLRPDISLALFAKEANIPQRTLSRAINGCLQRNFFEFINEMRVEEVKRRLLELETSGYNIDSIFSECGFRSRSTFFLVFKKMEGKTPAAWLEEKRKKV